MTSPEPENEPEGHLAAAKQAVEHALHEVGEGFIERAVEQHERWEAAGERAERHHDAHKHPKSSPSVMPSGGHRLPGDHGSGDSSPDSLMES